MKKILLPCLCFMFAFSQAQRNRLPPPFDFTADSIKASFVSFTADSTKASLMGDQYDRALDSQYQLGKDGSFEFRLKQFHLHHNLDNVFVMSLKQGKWVARYFDRNNGIHDGLVFTERAVDQAPVNQLWKLLVDKRVLTLPSQGKIANRLVGYKVDTANLPYGYTTHLEVIDGVEYEFSLHAPTGHRHYSYYSPQAYLNKFSNVEELFDAVMLIALVKKFLGLPLKVN